MHPGTAGRDVLRQLARPRLLFPGPDPGQRQTTAGGDHRASYLENRLLHTDLPPTSRSGCPTGQNYLSFDFAALDYAAPAKNQYAYKMEGLEADWLAAGTRRHADYPDLKPGTYTFRVKASNNSGVWNEQGTAVRITITPPFWQTWWFLGLVGARLVGRGCGAPSGCASRGVEARSRDLETAGCGEDRALEEKTLELQQLYEKSHELAVLEERNRLARELHDAVTQTLFSASLVAEALPTTWERDPAGRPRAAAGAARIVPGRAGRDAHAASGAAARRSWWRHRLDDLLRQLGEAASGREGIPVPCRWKGGPSCRRMCTSRCIASPRRP